jgi:hypothetical protein
MVVKGACRVPMHAGNDFDPSDAKKFGMFLAGKRKDRFASLSMMSALEGFMLSLPKTQPCLSSFTPSRNAGQSQAKGTLMRVVHFCKAPLPLAALYGLHLRPMQMLLQPRTWTRLWGSAMR